MHASGTCGCPPCFAWLVSWQHPRTTYALPFPQARRKPKIAKGARDMMPDQMAIREVAFDKVLCHAGGGLLLA